MTDVEPARVQTVYTAILQHLIDHGRAPHYTELANQLDISTEEARLAQAAAADAAIGCWNSPLTDYVGSWAPFSNIPTQYLVSVDGHQRWFGQ